MIKRAGCCMFPLPSYILGELLRINRKGFMEVDCMKKVVLCLFTSIQEIVSLKEKKGRGRQKQKTSYEKKEEEEKRDLLLQSTCYQLYSFIHTINIFVTDCCSSKTNDLLFDSQEVDVIGQAVNAVCNQQCVLYRYRSLWNKCRWSLVVWNNHNHKE